MQERKLTTSEQGLFSCNLWSSDIQPLNTQDRQEVKQNKNGIQHLEVGSAKPRVQNNILLRFRCTALEATLKPFFLSKVKEKKEREKGKKHM